MKHSAFKKIIRQYINGMSPTEARNRVEDFLRLTYKRSPFKSVELTRQRETLKETLWQGIQREIAQHKHKRRVYRNLVAVAAFIIILGAGGYIAGITLKHTPAMRVLQTGENQRKSITLADGSRIQMNAQSTLSFPERFTGDTREIALTGEAYFEVAKDPSRPFIITTADVTTTVVGTAFNIHAYAQEDIDVTVTEGKVKVAHLVTNVRGGKEQLILQPGEQALFSMQDSSLSKQKVDVAYYTNWQLAEFNFDLIPFNQVLQVLARAYHTKIDVTTLPAQEPCLIKARLPNNDGLEPMLIRLQKLVDFDYTFQNNILKIHNKGC